MKKFLTLAALLLLVACSDPEGTEDLLRKSNYTNIQITGYSFFGCDSKTDVYSTGFTAKAPNGEQVSGVVCRGVFKGRTLRLD